MLTIESLIAVLALCGTCVLQYWIYDRISSWKDTEIAALLR